MLRPGRPLPPIRRTRDIYPGLFGFDDEEDEDAYLLEDEMRVLTRGATRGKILHFIPSEQIKLLKGKSMDPEN